MALITGSWDNTKIVCGNHPHMATPPQMELQATSLHTMAYVCPKCSRLNCEDDEPTCKNQLSANEYEKMLDYVASVMSDADEVDEVPNLSNFSWQRKSIRFRVLCHENEKMTISVINKAAIEA